MLWQSQYLDAGELRGVPGCSSLLQGVLGGQESGFYQQCACNSNCKSSMCGVQKNQGPSPPVLLFYFCQSLSNWCKTSQSTLEGLGLLWLNQYLGDSRRQGGCLLRVSQGVSGVRQCPGRDLILSLRLIYCARHAPHGPTGVQAFCPTTSLIFGCSTFCTVVEVQVDQLPKICSKKTESRMSEQSLFPHNFFCSSFCTDPRSAQRRPWPT